MEAVLTKAWIVAGVKLGLGLFFVAAVVGIRVASVTPVGDAAEKPRSEEAMIADGVPDLDRPAQSGSEDGSTGGSLIARVTSGFDEQRTPGGSGSRDGDKLVSCQLGGKTQYMRADDCAMRGGRSTVFEDAP